MARRKGTPITDPALIERLCDLQRDVVARWNHSELSGAPEDRSLPAGAEYGYEPRGARFLLGGSPSTFVRFRARRGWWHFHPGWSFCRHELTPTDVVAVEVVGSLDVFDRWAREAGAAT